MTRKSERCASRTSPRKRQAAVYKIDFVEPVCLECGRRAHMVAGLLAYPREPEKAKRMFWMCDCGAIVACHPGTAIAMGRPANAETRYARKRAHDAFDALWLSRAGKGTRAAIRARENAYRWLAEVLGVAKSEAHIGRLDRAQCERVVAACRAVVSA